MSSLSNQSNSSENTKLENSKYNILSALGKESDFLYSTVYKYIQDSEKYGRDHLVELWNEMKKDKQKHLSMLRQALEKEEKENKLTKKATKRENKLDYFF